MHPELFRIPLLGWPVYGYGVMLVIGFFTALALAKFLARRNGLDPELFVNAALIALATGVIGARLSHVLENLSDFTRSDLSVWQNVVNVFNMRSGGLTYYGGFLLATPCAIVYALKKKVPLRLGMDIIAPCLMIGLGFGRVGCFLNGCCHGSECNLPWAVTFPYGSNAFIDQFEDKQHPLDVPPALTYVHPESGELRVIPPAKLGPQQEALAEHYRSRPVHPAQLYSTITALMLAALLTAYFTLPHVPGRVFALMLMLEGASRFVLESLRTEPPVWGVMSLSMVIGLMLVLAGAILWVVFGQIGSADEMPVAGMPATSAAAA
jgi:phosphatidylglycerol---prolipoprotein diacylglyceryl transferase